MINDTIINLLYILAAILFIVGLKMLGNAQKARQGNLISALGMLIAILAALVSHDVLQWQWIAIGMIAGAIVGAVAARLVAMTAMPEMVALFNGFGGAASLLVGWSEYHRYVTVGDFMEVSVPSLLIIIVTIVIGGATFTGSIMAWGKLSEKLPSKAIQYPGQQLVNALLLIFLLGTTVLFGPLRELMSMNSYWLVIITIVLSCILGISFVIPIGGGDMPVVISLLNSFSGMAACAAGFVITNNVLIVAGALVGSSGIILTNIMCKSMNRNLTNVLFSGFGSGKSKTGAGFQGEANPVSVEDAYFMLEAAGSVLIVPGYGMAVAQAQHAIQELAAQLEENGAEVNFAIHPVAGRMPGHMNVLLAEANVPYEQLKEMDDVNPTIESVDVVIVIGANDVVNPAARTDEDSPIYGMPVIDVDKARTVIVMKRSLNPGFAGIDNPLFFNDNTRMLFGDAKKTTQGLVAEFKD
ncbi:NAD(P)(+) transhydrogenase (Re/Si-specific) subunit beta [Amphibacillus cookii]|uniref:NAD(P)(+) transhydrogenase (Re/Si-specific) subunit beta n=1 Tax=Amphibacillus cookii TaxID=767787 RepID=UPI00195C62B6|nr:NAD(P)(+) transhydrogenase (Re/Si-specific) subunit beta [Amphibacillus cookii]MBM7540765.1 NAD(P) transhydrogenase subunit beta [Amphibacillus cookii]